MRGLYLLTMKPVTYAANVGEADLANLGATNPFVAALKLRAQEEGRDVVIVSAQARSAAAALPIRHTLSAAAAKYQHELVSIGLDFHALLEYRGIGYSVYPITYNACVRSCGSWVAQVESELKDFKP